MLSSRHLNHSKMHLKPHPLPLLLINLALLINSILPAQASSGYIYNADIKENPFSNQHNSPDETSSDQTPIAKFNVDPFTGSATYSYPLILPEGRKNLTPFLNLTYNSSNKNNANIIGYGWDISQNYIMRSDRLGTNHLYDQTNEFQINLNGTSGELKALALTDGTHGQYASLIENNFFTYNYQSNNSWEVITPDGVHYNFGQTAETRQTDPNDSNRTYKWMLKEIKDPNGNHINFEYFKDQNQIYPLSINYTGHENENGLFTINFAYEIRSDAFLSYRPTFRVLNQKRIKEINVTIKNDPSQKKWLFSYINGDNTIRSLLKTITEQATNENNETVTLPATEFTYSDTALTWEETSWQEDPVPVEFISDGGSDTGNRLADINGDCYVDLVASEIPDNSIQTSCSPNCDCGDVCITKNETASFLNTTTNHWQETSQWDSDLTFLENQLNLIDLNGDELPDIYRPPYSKDASNHESYTINEGNYWADYYRFDMEPTSDEGYRLVDINGDGLVDLLRKTGTTYTGDTSGNSIKLNNGKLGWVNAGSPWLLPAATAYSALSSPINYTQDSGMRFADANGDGLTDIIVAIEYDNSDTDANVNEYIQKLYLNNGKDGWIEEPNWSMPGYFTKIYYQSGKTGWLSSTKTNQCLYDVNGDGLIDWKGNKGVNDGVTGWPHSFPSNAPECGGSVGIDKYAAYRTADLNGDGIMDEFDTSETSSDTITTSKNHTVPDLLSTIRTTKGGSIEISYQFSTQYKDTNGNLLNPHLPLPIATVSQIIQNNGLDETVTSTFNYTGGRYYHYDTFRSEFAGFAQVTEKTNGRLTNYNFDQGCKAGDSCSSPFYYPGTTLKSSTDDTIWIVDGNYKRGVTSSSVFENTGFSWYKIQVVDQAIINSLPTGEVWDSDRDTFKYPVNLANYAKKGELIQLTISDSNGNKYLQTNSLWEVTDLGNQRYFPSLKSKTEFSFDTQGNHQEKSWEYNYDPSIGKLTQIKNLGEIKADLSNGNQLDLKKGDERTTTFTYSKQANSNIITLDQETYYDANNQQTKAIAYQYDSRGNLTQISNWLNTTNQWLTTKFDLTANIYGLTNFITNPRGYKTNFSYDEFNLYPQSKTNTLGHTTTYEYNYLNSQIKTQKSANNYLFSTTYDGFGRILTQSNPDPQTGITTQVSNTTYTDTTFPSYTTTKSASVNGVTIENRFFQDGWGRLVQEKKSVENGYIQTDYWYDNFGNPKTQTLPYPNTNFSWTDRDPNQYQIQKTYDLLNRLTEEKSPQGTIKHTYSLWSKTLTDANNHTKTNHFDAYQQLLQIDENNTDETYSTNYQYNSLGKITKITDAQNNERNFIYDSLSRLTYQEDLHSPSSTEFGKWTYTYDSNNNRLTQTDPNNQTITWTYDDLDRIQNEDWNKDGNPEIKFTYDQSTNGIGLLSQIDTQDEIIIYSYNPLGNTNQETKIIEDQTYITKTDYDLLNRIQKITYPMEALTTNYQYNSANQIEKILKDSSQNIIANIDYSPVSQPTLIEYGNGTTTTNTFEAAKNYKLTHKITTGKYSKFHVDTDQDSIEDKNDNCPNMSNSSQIDLDQDLIGDACDNDKDGDTINSDLDCDDKDSSLGSYDLYYLDADSDGYGENPGIQVCFGDFLWGNYVKNNDDLFPFDSAEWTDEDQDGIGDNGDLCPKTIPSSKDDLIDNQGCAQSQIDSDQDTLNDYEEINVYKTNPLLIDSDQDALTDDEEIFKYQTDPNQFDTDQNGLPDSINGFEVKLDDTNPKSTTATKVNIKGKATIISLNPELNNNPIKAVEYYLSNNKNNSSKDLSWKNASPIDGNFDSETELYTFNTDNLSPAIYTIKVRLKVEINSITLYSEEISSTLTILRDTDGDGLSDNEEKNQWHTNPQNSDSDRDQLKDNEEINIYGTNPNNRDTDNDKLPDGVEIFHYGTDPLKQNTTPFTLK